MLHWKNKAAINTRDIDPAIQSCLFYTGSLTRYLQEQCSGKFAVELQTEEWHLPLPDETQALQLRQPEYVFIRESWLQSDGHKLVFARTVIPRQTLQGKNRRLMKLGTTPLGEVLFADKTTCRTNVCFAQLTRNCGLYQLITANTDPGEPFWGRQSLFYIQNKPLLISEVFLPKIAECIRNSPTC